MLPIKFRDPGVTVVRLPVCLDLDWTCRDNVKMMYCIRLLLSFAILACPFNCMGAFDGGDAQSTSSPACTCCSHDLPAENSAPNQVPHSPDDDCPCPTCFCNGAVLPSGDLAGDIANDELQPSCYLEVAILLGDSQSTSLSASLADLHFPTSLPSGRFVRILHESFLL